MPEVDELYEESGEIPAGRKARIISPTLWAKLEEASKRQVAFSRVAAEEVIDDLRKDLTSAAVKAKYEVTTSTAHLDDGRHKLTFSARAKQAPKPAKEDPAVKAGK